MLKIELELNNLNSILSRSAVTPVFPTLPFSLSLPPSPSLSLFLEGSKWTPTNQENARNLVTILLHCDVLCCTVLHRNTSHDPAECWARTQSLSSVVLHPHVAMTQISRYHMTPPQNLLFLPDPTLCIPMPMRVLLVWPLVDPPHCVGGPKDYKEPEYDMWTCVVHVDMRHMWKCVTGNRGVPFRPIEYMSFKLKELRGVSRLRVLNKYMAYQAKELRGESRRRTLSRR